MLEKARKDFAEGNYRWVAQVMNQVVFADPDNREARELEADALEQLGYQAESGPWRSVYLQGAFELRNGIPKSSGASTASADILRVMSPEMLFDYLSIRLNGPKAAGKKIILNFNFPDLKSRHVLTVENGVLNYATGRQNLVADATITTTKENLDAILTKQASLNQKMASGEFRIDGNKEALAEFFGLLDAFPFWFNIVTP